MTRGPPHARPMSQRAHDLLAELSALHHATSKVDEKLRAAAGNIAAHHHQRMQKLEPKLRAPRTDDLGDEYLDSVFERAHASRY